MSDLAYDLEFDREEQEELIWEEVLYWEKHIRGIDDNE